MAYDIKTYKLDNNGLAIEFLESGNIRDIYKGNVKIKQIFSNNLENGANNIYLKVEKDGNISVTPLMGPNTPSKFFIGKKSAMYKGEFKGVNYSVLVTVNNDSLFFTVDLKQTPQTVATVYYGMDVSIADGGAVKNNEAYVCQYIDHKAYLGENGYVVCSRQNQGQASYLEQGSFSKVVSYSTDGFDFFKESYKRTNIPAALYDKTLSNRVYQYEFAYVALQSEAFDLSSDKQITFYCSYLDSIDTKITKPLLVQDVHKDYVDNVVDNYTELNFALDITFDNIVNGNRLTSDELDNLFPNKQFKEYKDNNLLSFFLEDKAYVTLPEKELLLERPTGNMIISGNYLDFEQTLANTTYMFGVFSSQIVNGNTSFNKLTSNIRNSLNVQKISGMRIFIKLDNEYRLLSMPSYFVAGLNYSKWGYKLDNDMLEVVTYVLTDSSKTVTKVSSKNNVCYDIIITEDIVLGPVEHEYDINYKLEDTVITFNPAVYGMQKSHYNEAMFGIKLNQPFELINDHIFYSDHQKRGENVLSLKLKTYSVEIVTVADNFNSKLSYEYNSFEEESSKYLNQISKLLENIKIDYTEEDKYKNEFNSYNYLLFWYANNALIHYTSPHGLEQYNGAAWGTRDLCQGPAEFFLSTANFSEVRRIIINLFSHQYNENGNWPQWFMFDRFYKIQQRESHGDIIVWPARLVGLYIKQTGDYDILNEKISFTDLNTLEFTQEKYTLLDHIKLEIENIEKSFIKGTYLSCYGGGDWDDTLQPANQKLTECMVSGWTVSLTYEMINYVSEAVKNTDNEYSKYLSVLSKNIKDDFNKYIVIDGIPAGFIIFEDDGSVKPVIHPRDKDTNMKYRLLPFNRGIISGMFTTEEKDKGLDIIDKNLSYPDGVRLMDKTVKYNGGEKTYFQRAETGANFGREIGLQYVHAHIRYSQALGCVGDRDKFIHALSVVNPIIMTSEVKNALPRQRNSYFSSSDATFINRYDAMENYDSLKEGKVGVKAGWRVYSSGPGIYTYQVLTNLFGINYLGENICFDPIIPQDAKSFTIHIDIANKNREIKYVNSGSKKVVTNNKEYTVQKEEKYREGGILVPINELGDKIEIHF